MPPLPITSQEMSTPLSTAQVITVEESWSKVEGLGAETVGVLLFKNIFEIAPQALPMFSFKDEEDLYNSTALKKHGESVVLTVGTAVAGLRDLGKLVPVLQALGERHVKVRKSSAAKLFIDVGRTPGGMQRTPLGTFRYRSEQARTKTS